MADSASPRKRSLFNKPSWSKPQALSNGNELFHRSTQTYVDVAAQAERDKQKRLARKEREKARRAEDERAGKRQRISSPDEDDEDDNTSSDESNHRTEHEDTQNPISKSQPKPPAHPTTLPKPLHSPKSLIKRYEAECAAKKMKEEQNSKPQSSVIIDLEDDEDACEGSGIRDTTEPTVLKLQNSANEDDQPASDEEFPELARQAREKARRKRLEQDIVSVTPDPSTSGGPDEYSYGPQSTHLPTPPPPPPDPVLSLLITSAIPNTDSLIVNRRLSQRLKEVKQAWAQRQGFSPEFIDTIFLTWRGKRLFDVTSCKSLGLSVDSTGNIREKDNIFSDMDGKIHLEVMTADSFEAHKKARNREVIGEEEKEEEATVVTKKEPGIRIICKAKDFSDFKLVVKPHTVIAKILNAFKSVNQVSDKEVSLFFDGDKLSPHTKIEETELSDMDTLDVVVR
ncbi:hypothetical protein P7C71_g5943, partial [Lecanoromycetidae sp. Uapishka_2]